MLKGRLLSGGKGWNWLLKWQNTSEKIEKKKPWLVMPVGQTWCFASQKGSQSQKPFMLIYFKLMCRGPFFKENEATQEHKNNINKAYKDYKQQSTTYLIICNKWKIERNGHLSEIWSKSTLQVQYNILYKCIVISLKNSFLILV